MIKHLHALVSYGLKHHLIDFDDITYAINQLAYKMDLDPKPFVDQDIDGLSIVDIVKPLLDYAVKINLIDDTIDAKDNFESYLMDTLTPRPSDLQKRFNSLSPKEATDYFYQMCQDNHYIKTERIEKNKHFIYPSIYGDIDITINISKPEKDPKTIAQLKMQKSSSYPSCLLCIENVGYYGNLSHPGRSHHRVISMTLNQEPFYFQYSPYVYYNEHAIVLHKDHIPMEISRKTFLRLFDFINQFPHYFLGSNAGLPIVGGSILDHEHYQGGSANFPIEQAKVFKTLTQNDVKLELLIWPLSVIRLSSKHLNQLIDLADKLRVYFENYSDESIDLLAKTNESHNAITPIARFKDGLYILDIALRNNRTSEKYPDGIFHPHKDVHAIKKENIGLIEVMGLAILPGRLVKDLEAVEKILNGQETSLKGLELYKDWMEMIERNPMRSMKKNIEYAAGKAFVKGLEDCGIFKQDEFGRLKFIQFVEGFLK